MTPLIITLVFCIAITVLFLLPGFFLLRVFLEKPLSTLPTWCLSLALGLGFLNFLMILMGKTSIHYTFTSLSIALFSAVFTLFLGSLLYRRFFLRTSPKKTSEESSLSFSHTQTGLFIILLVITVLIKTIYLSHAILPTATDLGHHMYWSKVIAESGTLPTYEKSDIVTDINGNYQIASPEPIADFIIGEHLPFAAIYLFTGIDFLSAFPILFLLFINLMSTLALVVLAQSFAQDLKGHFLHSRLFTRENIALATLFFFGPLYTLASPQAKFVSGGVVGNTLGNFFMPVIFYAFYRALSEKRSDFLALGMLLTFSLAYIHHLSTLMTLFVLIGVAVTSLIIRFNSFTETLRSWFELILRPKPLLVLLSACIFFFGIALPTYIETHAVGTALGTPTKTTRTGLSFYQITFSSGETRVALGLIGMFLLAALSARKTYASAFLLGWGGILSVMTFRPNLLFINIPSNRIGAYLSFPLGLLAAVAFIGFFALAISQTKKHLLLPGFLFLIMAFSSFFFALGSGSYDNGQTLLPNSKAQSALETFTASRFLAVHTTADDVILKDTTISPLIPG